MSKTKEKTTGFYFKMSQEEWDLVERRMAETNIRNKSAYIRKMCIDGHVLVMDPKPLNEIGRLLRITANNVNQIARSVNSDHGASRDDVAEINKQLAEIRIKFGELLTALSDKAGMKPGKHFIPPPNMADIIKYLHQSGRVVIQEDTLLWQPGPEAAEGA